MALRYHKVKGYDGITRKEVDVVGSAGGYVMNTTNQAFDVVERGTMMLADKSDSKIKKYSLATQELYDYLQEIEKSGFSQISDTFEKYFYDVKSLHRKKPGGLYFLIVMSISVLIMFGPFFIYKDLGLPLWVPLSTFIGILPAMLIGGAISAHGYKRRYYKMKEGVRYIDKAVRKYSELSEDDLDSADSDNKTEKIVAFERLVETVPEVRSGTWSNGIYNVEGFVLSMVLFILYISTINSQAYLLKERYQSYIQYDIIPNIFLAILFLTGAVLHYTGFFQQTGKQRIIMRVLAIVTLLTFLGQSFLYYANYSEALGTLQFFSIGWSGVFLLVLAYLYYSFFIFKHSEPISSKANATLDVKDLVFLGAFMVVIFLPFYGEANLDYRDIYPNRNIFDSVGFVLIVIIGVASFLNFSGRLPKIQRFLTIFVSISMMIIVLQYLYESFNTLYCFNGGGDIFLTDMDGNSIDPDPDNGIRIMIGGYLGIPLAAVFLLSQTASKNYAL